MVHEIELEGEARTLGHGVWHPHGNRRGICKAEILVLEPLIDLFSRNPVKEQGEHFKTVAACCCC